MTKLSEEYISQDSETRLQERRVEKGDKHKSSDIQ